ncbi:hypothetical protein AB1Y20_006095 [Prymnesium parvum]|uniref:Uncharacterized protein n=1 Tax=Prymnesium parvum TaxID=97485 RepID=A0AB34J365_PRYPA
MLGSRRSPLLVPLLSVVPHAALAAVVRPNEVDLASRAPARTALFPDGLGEAILQLPLHPSPQPSPDPQLQPSPRPLPQPSLQPLHAFARPPAEAMSQLDRTPNAPSPEDSEQQPFIRRLWAAIALPEEESGKPNVFLVVLIGVGLLIVCMALQQIRRWALSKFKFLTKRRGKEARKAGQDATANERKLQQEARAKELKARQQQTADNGSSSGGIYGYVRRLWIIKRMKGLIGG